MRALETDVFALIKPSLDAHTLGITTAKELLRECGYHVLVGDDEISLAVSEIKYEAKQQTVINWLKRNNVSVVGLSYRLDQEDALNIVGYLMYALERSNLICHRGGPIKSVLFAGLPNTCEVLDNRYKGFVKTFRGGESVRETLEKSGIPLEKIPKDIKDGSKYDDMRLEIGKEIIDTQKYKNFQPPDRSGYPEYGTLRDSVIKRLEYNKRTPFLPLMRAHVGPYLSSVDRVESVRQFMSWAKELAQTGFLDVLSIGTSQLTQSSFGEDWGDRANGGGVPINSPGEYREVWEASRPLLVRTYAGTNDVPALARIHEETMNISWHALSLWWFNRMDGRGPNDVLTNVRQHIETLKYIAETNKPFEPNVPHHFAFRGSDDVTYIVSAYLAAKLAKKMGIRTLMLQNMLNTPRYTWGVQDLAKSRALLRLIGKLEEPSFRVFLQPRAGLDYFKPDLYDAKIQLVAVTALMDDIDPHNEMSPPVIHVVSYSEASHLATPEIINESIQITHYSLQKYRDLRKSGELEDMALSEQVKTRELELIDSAQKIITAIEMHIKNPYSAEGLYTAFAAGFLPTPYLWDGGGEEFSHAKAWKTKHQNGSVKVVDVYDNVVATEAVIDYARSKINEIELSLRQRVI